MMNDLPLDQLIIYKPERTEPADFQYFWKNTMEKTRAFPLDPRFELVESGSNQLSVFDVTFNGFAGQPIKGWLIMPRQPKEKLPCFFNLPGMVLAAESHVTGCFGLRWDMPIS